MMAPSLLLAVALAASFAQPSWDAVVTIDGDPVMRGLPRDAIPAIDRPTFVPAAEATWMRDEEPVIGVAVDGTARAYPAWLLDGHENSSTTPSPVASSRSRGDRSATRASCMPARWQDGS